MRRLLLAAALLAAATCAQDRERRLATTFDEARQALRRGEFEKAQAIAERGLARAPADSAWAWMFRLYRGEILVERNLLAEVEPVLNASIPQGQGFDALRARQKYVAALALLSENKPKDALRTLEEASRLAPLDSDLQLEIGLQEGQARFRVQQPAEAERALHAVIRKAEEQGERFIQAQSWVSLGRGGLGLGRWDEAVARLEHVLSSTDLDQTTVFAGALINAGAAYARLGEFDRALELQQRALAYCVDYGKRSSYAAALGETGNTYLQQGAPQAALPYYQKAIAVAKDTNLPLPAAIWAGNLAAAHIDLKRWDEAERFNEEGKRLNTTLSRTEAIVYNNLNTAQIARGRGRLDDAERLFHDVLRHGTVEVRWQAHAGLADVALARSKTAEARTHFEAALGSIEKTRAELPRTEFRITFLTRLIRFYQSYVDALIDQGQIERALEIADSSRGRVLATRTNWPEPPKATAAAVRQLAGRSQAVLLSYWLARDRSYLWVVTASGTHLVRLPAAAEIAALVRQYNGVIGDALADPLASPGNAGDRLYDLLIKPASAWLPHGTRVILVADGALHGLNFETLPVAGATRHYWIEDVELQAAPGLAMLAAPRSGSAGPPSLLLMGDPVPRAAEFPALKYAGAEIANISKHFPNAAVVYTSAQASPAAYREATPRRFSFVHFAAHASANLESPLDSAVILSGPDDAFKLYARDVADVPLRAELVTVSACRSAGERIYSGEGLVGFAWAFLRAGSSRVIAGLWDVDDRSTSELMDHLYSGLAAGHRPAQALRAAKLALLTKGGNYRKPYYWGPFQLFTVVP